MEEAKEIGGEFVKTTEAFSTALVKNEEEKETSKIESLANKVLLTDANFKGIIKTKLDTFINKINAY